MAVALVAVAAHMPYSPSAGSDDTTLEASSKLRHGEKGRRAGWRDANNDMMACRLSPTGTLDGTRLEEKPSHDRHAARRPTVRRPWLSNTARVRLHHVMPMMPCPMKPRSSCRDQRH